jgi:hypothetical protein
VIDQNGHQHPQCHLKQLQTENIKGLISTFNHCATSVSSSYLSSIQHTRVCPCRPHTVLATLEAERTLLLTPLRLSLPVLAGLEPTVPPNKDSVSMDSISWTMFPISFAVEDRTTSGIRSFGPNPTHPRDMIRSYCPLSIKLETMEPIKADK